MRVKTVAMPRRKRKAQLQCPSMPEDPEAPFTVALHGEACTLEVVLSIPAPEEECIITLEPMATPLEFLPDTTFCQERPEHTKMTLPCNHAFGAMNLLYHMTRNHMTCPACRHGYPSSLDAASIPAHCRAELVAKVQAEAATEHLEADIQAHEDAVSIWRDEVLSRGPFDLVVLEIGLHARLLICGFEGDTNRPTLVNEFPLESSQASPGGFTMALSRYDSTRILAWLTLRTPRIPA